MSGRTNDVRGTGNFQIKLCGMRSVEDARAARDAGADMIGLVFATSPRQVSVEEAATIVAQLRADEQEPPRVVGVFVDATVEEVNEVAARVGLDEVQLCGVVAGEGAAASAPEPINVPVTRVLRVTADSMGDLAAELATLEERDERVLVDTFSATSHGGTGVALDWQALAAAAGDHPNLVLAGGLTPANVAEAIARVRPAGVDVSSGIETDGRKDPDRMQEFVRAARAASRGLQQPGARRSQQPGSRGSQDVEGGQGGSSRWDPDERGRFGGEFGGAFIPETLVPAVRELADAYDKARRDAAFGEELDRLLVDYVGRPTALTEARNLAAVAGGARIFLKREDLAHTGAHKINNAIGQALLARRMGKRRVIAETGAGQHGVATATACALLGLECTIFMGELDMARQQPNVHRMHMLGAQVRPVESGAGTLKDATNAAIRHWVATVRDTYYLIGSVVGMHPYPMLVRDFQSVIGRELRDQLEHRHGVPGGLPDAIVACVGGGSNAIGIFHPFLDDGSVRLYGAEAGGEGLDAAGRHAATLVAGDVGVLHGARMHLLQDADGQVMETHSISAGLDYPGVGPEHSHLQALGRASYEAVSDADALEALHLLCRKEGIVCALESAHAVALALRVAPTMAADDILVVNLSGRGDKDLATIVAHMQEDSP